MMTPLPNNEHQRLATRLGSICDYALPDPTRGQVFVGVNVSDRRRGWTTNYRCPDVAVFLAETRAKDCGTHWFGGPDFAVEITSPNDRSRDKLEFYAKVGVRELLIVDRRPWRLELYRRNDGQLLCVGVSTARQSDVLPLEVLPLAFQLQAAKPRPRVVVKLLGGTRQWSL